MSRKYYIVTSILRIDKGCTFPRDGESDDELYQTCRSADEDIDNGTAVWEYTDERHGPLWRLAY